MTNISGLMAMFITAVGLVGVAISDTPEVKVSYTTQSCVGVVSKNPEHNCHNLPDKYTKVWVN